MTAGPNVHRRLWMGAHRRTALVAAFCVATISFGGARFVPLPESLTFRPSTVVLDARGAPLHVFLSEDQKWRLPTDVDAIDSRYIDALLAFEDRRFLMHPGVDPIAFARAALANAKARRIVSGGSTITMQLVRLLEPRARTVRSKLVEMLRAFQLELRFSKREILRLYLERAPYGRNLEGIETASWALFQHSARSLSEHEIATLLALPQRPTERSPSVTHVEVLRQARDDVALRLAAAGVFDARDVDTGRLAPVPTALASLPRRAPHAARWYREQHQELDVIQTLIDARVQNIAEHAMNSERKNAEDKGISAGAIVIVEHGTGAVVGLVGGFDFLADRDGAQIPAFATPRATGSTLKPFIYAEAIDEGRVLPDTLVEDVPRNYGTYAPRNFDGGFEGEVRLEDALSRSLNLPFVDLLQKIGTERFLGTLRQLGVASLVDAPDHYGLSIAAGSLEMTPLELAGAFAALARDGNFRSLALVPNAEPTSVRVFSTGAAFLTRRALSIRDRPDFPTRGRHLSELHAVHWKTGTSFGYRDAWAAGSGPRYTVVVWQGNMDRRPSIHLVGAEAAAPLLFDILEALASKEDPTVDEHPPADLISVEVCTLSGRLPSPACPHAHRVLARGAHIPVEKCPFHEEVEIEVGTGLRVLPGCRAGKETRTEAVTVWPANVRRFLNDNLRSLPHVQGLHPTCDNDDEGPPQIVSPMAGMSLILVPGLELDKQEVPLQASGAGTIAWFVDGIHLGDAEADQKLWWEPRVGKHVLVAMDDKGRKARVAVHIISAEAQAAAAVTVPPSGELSPQRRSVE